MVQFWFYVFFCLIHQGEEQIRDLGLPPQSGDHTADANVGRLAFEDALHAAQAGGVLHGGASEFVDGPLSLGHGGLE